MRFDHSTDMILVPGGCAVSGARHSGVRVMIPDCSRLVTALLLVALKEPSMVKCVALDGNTPDISFNIGI